jgi:hypothetical protein
MDTMASPWTTLDTFGDAGWARLKKNTSAWWAGEIDRPLLAARVHLPCHSDSPDGLPYRRILAAYLLEVPMDRILRTWDWYLRGHVRYLGDAYPHIWADFGASFLAALNGGDLTADSATTWIHPIPGMTPDRLHFRVNVNNPWHRRYEEFCREADKFWKGKVQIGYSTGGILDAISTLLGPEDMLMALMDEPEEIKRLVAEAERMSWHYYRLARGYLKHHNHGYSCWAANFSEKSYRILECDACCMIGPDLFREFVQPSLNRLVQGTDNTFYHLDGPGALRHLDALLSIESLKGIQWVPGDGEKRPWDEWSGVIARILEAGKKVQLSYGISYNDIEAFDRLVQKLGTAKGITANVLYGGENDMPVLEKFLGRYGVI